MMGLYEDEQLKSWNMAAYNEAVARQQAEQRQKALDDERKAEDDRRAEERRREEERQRKEADEQAERNRQYAEAVRRQQDEEEERRRRDLRLKQEKEDLRKKEEAEQEEKRRREHDRSIERDRLALQQTLSLRRDAPSYDDEQEEGLSRVPRHERQVVTNHAPRPEESPDSNSLTHIFSDGNVRRKFETEKSLLGSIYRFNRWADDVCSAIEDFFRECLRKAIIVLSWAFVAWFAAKIVFRPHTPLSGLPGDIFYTVLVAVPVFYAVKRLVLKRKRR